MTFSNNKKFNPPVIAVAAVVVLAITVATLITVLTSCKKEKTGAYKVETGDVVLTVGDTDFTENQLRFFATLQFDSEANVFSLLYLDSEEEQNTALKEYILNFAKEYVSCVNEAKALGLSLTDEDKAEMEANLKEEYEAYKKAEGKVLAGDAFYDYYYGLSEAQFREFSANWMLVEKYYAWCEEQADLSETAQKKAFDDYYTGVNATAIVLSLDGLSDSDRNTKVTLANELLELIIGGTDMTKLVEKHSEDEALSETDGKFQVTPLFENAFPEIYEWSLGAKAGDLAVIESETAVYVLRCDSVIEFSDMVNTDELLATTKSVYVDTFIHNLIDSNKYKVTKHEKYDSLDYKTMIKNAIAQWTEIWSDEM